jgi:hypothetical protein
MKAVSLVFALFLVGLTGCKANPCNKLRDCCAAVQGNQSPQFSIARGACSVVGTQTNRDVCGRQLESIRQAVTSMGGTTPAACNP